MRNLILALVTILFVGCSNNGSSDVMSNLNGYWTIDTVEKPDGTAKEFPFTNHMDYFEVQGKTGTKSRVSPTYDGGFISYGDPVKFVWEKNENQVILNFESGERAYSQILRKATDDELELIHEDGTIYRYKKHTPNEEQ